MLLISYAFHMQILRDGTGLRPIPSPEPGRNIFFCMTLSFFPQILLLKNPTSLCLASNLRPIPQCKILDSSMHFFPTSLIKIYFFIIYCSHALCEECDANVTVFFLCLAVIYFLMALFVPYVFCDYGSVFSLNLSWIYKFCPFFLCFWFLILDVLIYHNDVNIFPIIFEILVVFQEFTQNKTVNIARTHQRQQTIPVVDHLNELTSCTMTPIVAIMK